jgi:hypothetical protein
MTSHMSSPSPVQLPSDDEKYLIENDVKKYLEFKEVIKMKQKEIKEYKQFLKTVEDSILGFMTNNDIPVLNFKGTESLMIEKKTSKKGLQKTLLDEKFNSALSVAESDETKDCLETLRNSLDDREVSEKTSLKYTK